MRVVAIKYIGEGDSGDSPAFEMARVGQELLIIEEIEQTIDTPTWKQEYKYICQDIEKRYGKFYVKNDEVKELT